MLISSQRYLDDATVAAKRAAQDYAVTVTPVFEAGYYDCQAVLDGHHSLAAAHADGVEPVMTVATVTECDTIGYLVSGDIDSFLIASRVDADWYDVDTGADLF